MSVPKTATRIRVLETNGTKTPVGEDPEVIVRSHWNYSDHVVIMVPGGDSVTVSASELLRAIRNTSGS